MKRALGGRLLSPVLAAALLAVCASVAVAEALGDEDPVKDAACATMGCTNGSRVCGSATLSWWKMVIVYWDIPVVYKEEQNFNCYEPQYQ